MKDIVCAEAELSIAVNQIVNYANFLASSIETYISILSDIQTRGIEDALVSAQLTQLALNVQPYKQMLVKKAEEVQAVVKSYVEDVAAADKFQFPEDPASGVSALLAQFQ